MVLDAEDLRELKRRIARVEDLVRLLGEKHGVDRAGASLRCSHGMAIRIEPLGGHVVPQPHVEFVSPTTIEERKSIRGMAHEALTAREREVARALRDGQPRAERNLAGLHHRDQPTGTIARTGWDSAPRGYAGRSPLLDGTAVQRTGPRLRRIGRSHRHRDPAQCVGPLFPGKLCRSHRPRRDRWSSRHRRAACDMGLSTAHARANL